MGRELTPFEDESARYLCRARNHSNSIVTDPCPACRAAVVRLVDGASAEATRKPDCYMVLDADGHSSGTAPHVTLDGALADVAAEQRERPHDIAPQILYCYLQPPASAEPWPPSSAEDVAYLTVTWRRPMSPVGDPTFEQTRRRILAVLTHAQQAQEKGR